MLVIPIPTEPLPLCRPVVIYALIALNLALHTLTVLSEDRFYVLAQLGLLPNHPTLLSWVSHLFFHLGPAHLIPNLVILLLVGDKVEDWLGRRRFLLLYLLSGWGAAALYAAMAPASLGGLPLLGAAGAVSGIVGAYVVLFPKLRPNLGIYLAVWRLRALERTGLGVALAWVGYYLFFTGLGSFGPWQFRLAPWLLIGGMGTGALLGWFMMRVGRPSGYGTLIAEPSTPESSNAPEPSPAQEASKERERIGWSLAISFAILTVLSVITLPIRFAPLLEPPAAAPAAAVPTSDHPLTPTNAAALRLLAEWNTGTQPERAAISADGRWVALWQEQSLSFWDAQTGTRLATHDRPLSTFTYLMFTPAPSLLLLEEREGGMQRTEWSPTGEQRHSLVLPDRVQDLLLSPNGEQVEVAGLEQRMGGRQIMDAWSADGRLLVTGGWNSTDTLHLWRLPEGEYLREIVLGEEADLLSLALSPDGESIALSTTKGTLALWSSEGTQRYATPLPVDDYAYDLLFSPDGTLLATATETGYIFVVESATGTPVAILHHPLHRDRVTRPNFVIRLAFTTDGRLVSVDGLGSVRWWGIPTP